MSHSSHDFPVLLCSLCCLVFIIAALFLKATCNFVFAEVACQPPLIWVDESSISLPRFAPGYWRLLRYREWNPNQRCAGFIVHAVEHIDFKGPIQVVARRVFECRIDRQVEFAR
jgi:hypothetical protein